MISFNRRSRTVTLATVGLAGAALVAAGGAGARAAGLIDGRSIKHGTVHQLAIGEGGVSGHGKTPQSEIQTNSLSQLDVGEGAVSGHAKTKQSEIQAGSIGLDDLSAAVKKGITGPAGSDGTAVLHGTTAPAASAGAIGDFYIDTASHEIYGPKTQAGWGDGTNLIGPAGSAAPSTATGRVDDIGGNAYGAPAGVSEAGALAADVSTLSPAASITVAHLAARFKAAIPSGRAAVVRLMYQAPGGSEHTAISCTIPSGGSACTSSHTHPIPAESSIWIYLQGFGDVSRYKNDLMFAYQFVD